jgi:ATP-dependent DNA helicase RecQ
MGFIEIAYDAGNVLRLGSGSKEVLFENKEVHLVKMLTIAQRKEKEAAKEFVATKKSQHYETLFNILVQVRFNLSRAAGIPPYQIFPDTALMEMARKKPIDHKDLMDVTGVSEAKALNYGQSFLSAVREFLEGQTNNNPGVTHLLTYHRVLEGHEVEEIASIRKLATSTIQSHIVKLYVEDLITDIQQFISKKEIDLMLAEPDVHSKEISINDLFEKWNGAFSYFQIRLLQAHLKKISR